MDSRQRIFTAARCGKPDRVPLMLWIEPHAAVKIATRVVPPANPWKRACFDSIARLQETLPTEKLRNGAPFLSYPLQAEFSVELGADMVDTMWGFPPAWLRKLEISGSGVSMTDMYGIRRGIGGIYLEVLDGPCKTREDLDRYRFPNLSRPIHYRHIRMMRKAFPHTALACICPGVQDWSQMWHGMENIYTGVVEYPETIERFFRRMARHSLQIIRGALRAGADIISILDDYGSQDSLLMSPAMWERFTYPCLEMQCREIHRHGGIAMLHSCGSVAPLLDRIVAAGVDMLHPFQNVGKNNLADAKMEYGGRLCFMTGIDVQGLPDMTPAEVRESVLESVRTGNEGGGFVLSTMNAIQVDTPGENLKALFDTIADVKEGRY